jgi:S-adenosylmethionine-diacylglycerol 3-amino-3-carboxypropyl transferase
VDTRELADQLTDAPPLWVQTEEDANTTLQALGPAVTGTVLCVASGGDTPLALLGAGAREVIAVDINPAQVAVAELKARSVELLDLPSLEILWLGNDPAARLAIYKSLEERLSPASHQVLGRWLNQADARPLIEQGGMQGVGTELREREPVLAALLPDWFQTEDLAAQREYHDRHLQPLAGIIAALRQARAERWFGAGGNESDASVAREMQDRFKRRFRHLVEHIPVAENPYAAHLLLGAYLPDARPGYLTAAGHARLMQAAGKISFVVGDLIEVAASLPLKSLDAADLSNVADLLPEDEMARLFSALASVLRPGGRVVHRNLVWEEPYAVAAGFARDMETSRVLAFSDRSFVYSAVTVDVFRGGY